MRNVLGVAVLAMSLALYASAAGAQLYFSQDNNLNGLYTLSTTTGAATLVGAGNTAVFSNTVGLAESGNPSVLLGSTWTQIATINADGSGATVLPNSASAEGLAYDPSANLLYGAINGRFFTLDPATGTLLSPLPGPGADVEGLAYSPLNGGTIYGLAGFAGPRGNLYAYDIAGASWSLVGFTGIEFDLCGLAFDPAANTLYGIGSQDPNLYAINPTTAAAVLIGNTGLRNTGGGLAFIGGAAVPEPGSAALLVGLLGGAGVLLRRRR